MKYVTYNLQGDDITSDKYYEKVSVISRSVKKIIFKQGNEYLNDFMQYIEENHIELLRTKDEYAIEFLMVGVMLSEYNLYGNTVTKGFSAVFKLLNKLRQKDKLKNKVDIIKGVLISSILYKKNNKEKYDLKNVVYWMNLSGDFNEEVYRLKVWISFFKNKDRKYINNLIKAAIDVTEIMEKICDDAFITYVKPLEKFLKNAPQKYKNREDLIYCNKGKKQYYFNMLCAQIMNEVYHEEFLKCKNKKIFAPACMRQVEKKCKCVKGNYGYICRKCSSVCNINLLSRLVEKKNIEVCIIPHETDIKKLNIKEKDKIGIIGIACITNLMSGGWKALRLGFIPQCVFLDYCGCEKHWLDKGAMTSINSLNILKLTY